MDFFLEIAPPTVSDPPTRGARARPRLVFRRRGRLLVLGPKVVGEAGAGPEKRPFVCLSFWFRREAGKAELVAPPSNYLAPAQLH